MEAEGLLLAVNSGKKLSKAQIEDIRDLLNSYWLKESARRISLDDVYAYLQLISRARLLELRKVVEAFLESKDGLTAALALEILCLDWNLTDDFLQEVISFAIGQSWDSEGDVQEVAIKVLGELLASEINLKAKQGKTKLLQKHLEVLKLLLAIFNDREISDWTRKISYFALCRAAGVKAENLPSAYIDLELSSVTPRVDNQMLSRLTALVQSSSDVDSSLA